ncbi:hypothetical protein [Sediminicola luteus]|uniref:LamG-like jellyroll fold domain-containing protein n=1 Tax=Sediminicola luteus TaxID=319238 RepID=A0A2A4G3E3_9FLAO|nr:hypothetical protein [Sediminicola luteus]PCE63197.1 hypothetical protein B7P33_13280 [Sediminicola luteus]
MRRILGILCVLLPILVQAQDKEVFSSVLRTNRYTTAPYYVEIDYPKNLPGMIARYRADSTQTIIDYNYTNFNANGIANGYNASQPFFSGDVFQWVDISYRDTNNDGINDTPNNNHLTAHNRYRTSIDPWASATYVPNTATSPSYRTNAKVQGDGVDDHLFKDISPNLTDDFTFIFVMRATNPNPGNYNSFIASSSSTSQQNPNGPRIGGAWQVSTTNDRSTFYFGYCRKTNSGTSWLPLIPFDTQVHVFYIEYDKSANRLLVSVDGVTRVNHTVNTSNGQMGPIIDELRLYRNRNMDTYIAAEFNEFFLAEVLFDESQKRKITNYLLAKWGVSS